MITIVLLGAFIASSFTLGKIAMNYSAPIFLIGARFFFAGLIIGAYYILRYKRIPRFSKQQWWEFAQITFFGFYLGPMLVFWALFYLTSSKAALLYSASPFVAALFSYWIFKEKMTSKKWLGLGIGLIGFIPAIMTREAMENGGSIVSMPEIAIFIGVICFAYGWVLIRKFLQESSVPETFVTSLGMTLGGAAALITSFFCEWGSGLPVTNIPYVALLLGGLILFGNIIGYILYVYNLKNYTATLMTFGEMLVSIFGAFYGWLFLHETVGLTFFISVALFLTGMYIFYKEEKDLGYFMEE